MLRTVNVVLGCLAASMALIFAVAALNPAAAFEGLLIGANLAAGHFGGDESEGGK